MKTSLAVIPRWFIVNSAVALCVLTGATALAQSQTNKMRIGVYDSRAIAIMYYNSTNSTMLEYGKSLRADYEKAKADKDEKRVKELDAKAKLMQRRLHEQAFSTGTINQLMAKSPLKEALPAVARKAGVQAIVSKWELNFQSADVELVDVTDDLVALFHPDENRWKRGKVDLQNHPPVPIDEITDDMD
jgi:hypothetical protein